MEDNKKIYLSAMLPIDRLDDDDDTTSGEIVADHLVQYEFIDLLSTIGTQSFKETYNVFIDDIKEQSFDNHRTLCQHILDRVQEVYKFEFPENIHIYSDSDVDEIFHFIEFLEFDNLDFLIKILENFTVDFVKDDIVNFFKHNGLEVIKNANLIDHLNLPIIFVNLLQSLEINKLVYIIAKMTSKNSRIISNELRLRELGINSENT